MLTLDKPLKFNFHDDAIISGKVTVLNGVLKVPITIMTEMIQWYHITELPPYAMFKVLQKEGDIEYVPIIKPIEEIELAISDVESIPATINHPKEDVFGDDPLIKGQIKQLYVTITDKKAKGIAYLNIKKIGEKLADEIIEGRVVDISVGGSAWYELTDHPYAVLKQTHIYVNHVAILPNDRGRCPAGICGLNMDSAAKIGVNAQKILHPLNESTLLSQQNLDIKALKSHFMRLKKEDDMIILNTTSQLKKDSAQIMTHTEDDYQKLLKKFNDMNQKVEKSSEKIIADLNSQLSDKDIEIKTIFDENAKLQKEIKDSANAIEFYNKHQEEEIVKMNTVLKDKGWDEKVLGDMCDKEKRVIYNTILKLDENKISDNAPVPPKNGFQKPGQQIRDKKTGGKDDPEPLNAAVIDMNNLYKEENE